MIIQGTNKPILIDFEQDMSWLKAIEIGLAGRALWFRCGLQHQRRSARRALDVSP